jgi:hypothetical protein
VAGSCEHGNETSGSIRGGEFIHQLSYYQLLKDYNSVALVSSPVCTGLETNCNKVSDSVVQYQ